MKLLKSSASFFLGTLLSRVLGFVRDATIASYFGASHVSDAFFIAFRLPNTFRRVLGEGGFNPAFVPMYAKATKEGRGDEFLSKVFSLYIISIVLITVTGTLLSEYVVRLLAPGVHSTQTFELAVYMARFLFSYLVFVGLSALFMGVLNVKGSFFIPAVAQAVFNLAFTITLLLSTDSIGYRALILGVLLGGLAQVLINIPFLLKHGVRLSSRLRMDEEVKEFLKRLLPSLGSFGVGQLSLFIDTFLASFLGKGVISYLYYANRLFLLPLSLISTSVANALLALLSSKGRNKEDIELSMRVIILLTLPASAGLVALSGEIVELVYRRGSFSQEDSLITAKVLSIYSLSLVFFSLSKILSSELFSRGDTFTPMKASLITVVSEGMSAYTFAFLLGFGMWGLPMGTVLSSIINLGYLSSKVENSLGYVRAVSGTLLKGLIASATMVYLLYILKDLLVIPLLIKVPLLILTGAIAYFCVSLVLREELSLSLFKSLIKKVGYP